MFIFIFFVVDVIDISYFLPVVLFCKTFPTKNENMQFILFKATRFVIDKPR
jgi:hypothetical protein